MKTKNGVIIKLTLKEALQLYKNPSKNISSDVKDLFRIMRRYDG